MSLPNTSFQSDPVVIVLTGDNAYAFPMAVTISSALRNLDQRRHVEVHLFHDGITPANRNRIELVAQRAHPHVQVNWLDGDVSAFRHLHTSFHYSHAIFMRLLIPALLPNHQRALYLDCDLVVERDLAQLWDMPIGEHFCLAVENYIDPTVATGLRSIYIGLGLAPETPYLNSGVLVINLRRWREERIAEQVVELLTHYRSQLLFPDQDAITAVLAGRWGKLDPLWNVQQSTLADYGPRRHMSAADSAAFEARAARDAYIFHYTGTRKPWQVRYRGRGQERFLRHARLSGWFDGLTFLPWATSRRLSHVVWKGLFQLKQARRQLRGSRGLAIG